MTWDLGTYGEEIVRESYESYVSTMWDSIYKNAQHIAQVPLTATLVCGSSV